MASLVVLLLVLLPALATAQIKYPVVLNLGDSIANRSQDFTIPPDHAAVDYPDNFQPAGWHVNLASLMTRNHRWPMGTAFEVKKNASGIVGPRFVDFNAGGTSTDDTWKTGGGGGAIYWRDYIYGHSLFDWALIEWAVNDFTGSSNVDCTGADADAPCHDSLSPAWLDTRANQKELVDLMLAGNRISRVFYWKNPGVYGKCNNAHPGVSWCENMWEAVAADCLAPDVPYDDCTAAATCPSCPGADGNGMPDLYTGTGTGGSYGDGNEFGNAQYDGLVFYSEAAFDQYMDPDAAGTEIGDAIDWWFERDPENPIGSAWTHPNSWGQAEIACQLAPTVVQYLNNPDHSGASWQASVTSFCGTRPPEPSLAVDAVSTTWIDLDIGGVTDPDGDAVRTWAWCVCNETDPLDDHPDPTCETDAVRQLGDYTASDRTQQRTGGTDESCINTDCIAQSGDAAGEDWAQTHAEPTPDYFEVPDAAAGTGVTPLRILGLTTGTAYRCTAVSWDGIRGSFFPEVTATTD